MNGKGRIRISARDHAVGGRVDQDGAIHVDDELDALTGSGDVVRLQFRDRLHTAKLERPVRPRAGRLHEIDCRLAGGQPGTSVAAGTADVFGSETNHVSVLQSGRMVLSGISRNAGRVCANLAPGQTCSDATATSIDWSDQTYVPSLAATMNYLSGGVRTFP